jgi:SAM-dependent methyltransferase
MRSDEYLAMYNLEERFWWYRGMRSVTASILERYLDRKGTPPRILDVGCGTGYSLSWLGRLYRTDHTYGIDVSQHAADIWNSRDLHTAAIASASDLPFESNQFDLVTCFDVVYQFSPDRSRRALSEIHRVLKPGGLVFIREPAYDWMRGSHDLAVATVHRYTRRELKASLASLGFSLLRTTYCNSLLFWAAVPHRLVSRISGKDTSDVRPVSKSLDRAFGFALDLEAKFVRRFAFPFGLSVVAIARRQ